MAAQKTFGELLKEGLADALGFVVGALAGWQLGVLLGFDFIDTPGYGSAQLVGLVLIVAGCGVGRWVARRLLSIEKS